MLPHTHTHTFSPVQMIPFRLIQKIGHILSHVCRSACWVDPLLNTRALPIATHEESRLGLFTDLASAVLATAAEEDAGGGLKRGRSRVGDVGGCRSGFCVVIDTSQYLMEIDLFRCCGL